ncbi:aldose 1-epimerase family protein [Micromonospora sp. DR5-3]|uniref:aldose 1-epimerase family protein n=1 Tax=unclassified Micromonospora TaxID=2617518 RepID=UPI0011D5C460|nr:MULTISPECIES: aldose 1-epimerase family protein [unclassified Micromonospora]MCW3814529.1 aldose 1-epimerase family protein [Micromonospora sp. DR5-3]TYC23224.1 aldose 1-epimerase family protein [Micromonospora sp. MP36]
MGNGVGQSPSGAQWTIAADGHEAVVVEVGGGLRAYRHDGVDHLDGYAADELCPGGAGQVLAPWPNRIRDGAYTFGERSLQLDVSEPSRNNAIHGLVNWVSWHLVERADDSVTVGYDLPARPGYPWPLRLRTRWRVGADGLRAEHEVTNLAGEAAPVGFSVHPYLRLPKTAVAEASLRVPARTRVMVDSRLLPIGVTPVAGTEYDFTEPRPIGDAVLDVTFGDVVRDADGGSAVSLAAPDDAARLQVWADREFGWWQVFTGDTLSGERRRRSVAIEPMTCPPDAFRSGRDLIALAPGDTWRGAWGVRPGA